MSQIYIKLHLYSAYNKYMLMPSLLPLSPRVHYSNFDLNGHLSSQHLQYSKSPMAISESLLCISTLYSYDMITELFFGFFYN